MELCGLGSWRTFVRFRCLPCRHGETSWTGSWLAWPGRRMGLAHMRKLALVDAMFAIGVAACNGGEATRNGMGV